MPPPRWKCPVRRIVSGGQTGVDQGALEAAIGLGMDHAGWCPRGRIAEDGTIPTRFKLKESHSSKYSVRTEQNVLDSDGTLILFRGELTGGTAYTHRMALKHRRPCLLVDLSQPADLTVARGWLGDHGIEILNIAGPRESTFPGISQQAQDFVTRLLLD